MSTLTQFERTSEVENIEAASALGRREQRIRSNVLASLGHPVNLLKVAVLPLWGDKFRVNVWTGASDQPRRALTTAAPVCTPLESKATSPSPVSTTTTWLNDSMSAIPSASSLNSWVTRFGGVSTMPESMMRVDNSTGCTLIRRVSSPRSIAVQVTAAAPTMTR